MTRKMLSDSTALTQLTAGAACGRRAATLGLAAFTATLLRPERAGAAGRKVAAHPGPPPPGQPNL